VKVIVKRSSRLWSLNIELLNNSENRVNNGSNFVGMNEI